MDEHKGEDQGEYTCEECWTQVLKRNAVAHGAWHGRLSKAASDAHYAAGMMRPIG